MWLVAVVNWSVALIHSVIGVESFQSVACFAWLTKVFPLIVGFVVMIVVMIVVVIFVIVGSLTHIWFI